MGTLEGASVGYRAFAATTNPPEIMARAELTLDTCLAQGTVAIRSHTNIESEGGLRGRGAWTAQYPVASRSSIGDEPQADGDTNAA
jgi:hypothetical protein